VTRIFELVAELGVLVRGMIRRNRVLPLALALVLTACGTTLPRDTQTTAGPGVATDGLSATSSDEVAGGAGLTASGGVSSGGTTSGSPRVGSGGAVTPGANSAAGGGSTAGAAPGDGSTPAGTASDEPIRIGVVAADVGALFAVFGAAAPTDVFYLPKKFFEHFNENGGIGGRQVEGVYVTVDIAADYNAEGQRACEVFTQDDRVDMVMTFGFSNEVMLSCLRQHGLVVYDSNTWTSDTAADDHPNWFTPNAIRVDRYIAAAIDVSAELGVLKRGDKLGVLFEDCPWGQRVYKNVVQSAAAKHGVATEQATVKCIENLVADLGPVTNQSRAAVLRFRSTAVTHVLVISAAEGFIVDQFTQAASEQRYLPKYIITTNGFPNNNGDPESAVHFAPDAKPNMTGVGWVPYTDVGEKAEQEPDPQAATKATCREVDPTMWGGEEMEGTDRWARLAIYYGACDLFFTLRATLQSNGVRFGIDEFAAGYAAALAELPSAAVAGGRWALGGTRRDGIGFVQPFSYDPASERFAYGGPPRKVA
jgi:hypothetical protein